MKGATKFDQLCHRVFSANGNGANYYGRKTGVKCGSCGNELEAYYCEERLYLVECSCCKTKALVMAGNPEDAAYKTFGHAVYSVDDMQEQEEKKAVCNREISPAADVAPVVHGRWDSSGRYRFIDGSIAVRCTKCGCSLHEKEYTENVWNYCPVCGSIMDLEVCPWLSIR